MPERTQVTTQTRVPNVVVENSTPELSQSTPDQPSSVNADLGSDPSLSDYERLFDELFARIRKCLATDIATQSEEQRTKLRLSERNGLLWRDHLLYVPDDVMLRHDILYWHHDVPWCAHLGIEKTVKLVQRQFFWPGMESSIRKYIESCYNCQANKPDRRSRRPALTPLVAPDSCWHTIGVDLIVDLPPTAGEEYNAICVFVCHLSKMVRLIATRTTLDTEGFAKLFIRDVFPHYGLPRIIVSDRGRQWNSEFFRALCDRAGIRLNLSTAYHPQTNGLVERTNEVIETALRHFVAADHRDWDEHLPFVEFALNDTYHQSTQATAFRMNRVTLPRNPFDVVVRNSAANAAVKTDLASWMGMSETSGSRTVLQAQEQFAWARRCVHLAKSRMKAVHDKHNAVVHLYDAGQLVWLNVKNIPLRHPSLRHKLTPKYMGPLKVLEAVGRNAVRLELPESLKQVHPTMSVSLVKPFMVRAGVVLPPVNLQGELEWEVEAVIDHNLLRSRRKHDLNLVEFKVKWKGDFETSWHEFVDFEHSVESVERYLKNSCTRSVRLQIYSALKPEELLLLSSDLQAEAALKQK
jgi:Integrase zinc binding domain